MGEILPFTDPAQFNVPSRSSSLAECFSRRPLANLDVSVINLDQRGRKGELEVVIFFSNQNLSEDIRSRYAGLAVVESLVTARYFGQLYEESMDLELLNEVIRHYAAAEEASRGIDFVCRRPALQGLSICYLLRYMRLKNRSDFDEAVNVCCSRSGQDHSHSNPWFHFRVADSYRSRFDRLGDRRDLEVAVDHYHTALSHPFPRNVDYLVLSKYLTLGYRTYPEFRVLLLARTREAKLAIFSHDTDEAHRLEISKLLLDLLRENFRQNKDPQILKEAIAVDRETSSISWSIWERENFLNVARNLSDSSAVTYSGVASSVQYCNDLADSSYALPNQIAWDLLMSLQIDENFDSTKVLCCVESWFDGCIRNADFVRILLVCLKMQQTQLPEILESLCELHPTSRGLRATLCDPEPGTRKPFVFILSSSDTSDEILAVSSNHEEVFPFVRNLADVHDILSLPDPLLYVLEAEEVWVPPIMHFLQLELDDLASPYRKACMKLLRALARKNGVLPPSLFLKDVKRRGFNALRGGGFADIWKGEASGKVVCLKVLRMFIESDDRTRDHIISEFCHEALLWRQLNHPNVLPFLGVNNDLFAPGFCLISPWMKNGDIVTFLKNNPNHDRLDAIYQISKGLAYLHYLSPPIIHGDIRGANILVDDNLRCCLADFGLALAAESQVLASTTGGLRGSVRWMAPELMDRGVIPKQQGQPRDKTLRDIYAFGCTSYEILTGKPPFSDQSMDVTVILDVIRGRRPARPTDVWCPDSVWNLIERCWAQDSRERPRASNARNFLDRLHYLQKQGDEGHLNLEFDADTSGPIFIDLSDDDECDWQSCDGSDDESDLQSCRESSEAPGSETDPLDPFEMYTALAQGSHRTQGLKEDSIPTDSSCLDVVSGYTTSAFSEVELAKTFDCVQAHAIPRPLKHSRNDDSDSENDRTPKRVR